MLELKKDVQVWVPVRMVDAAGAPIAGLTNVNVVCSVFKYDGTEAVEVVGPTTWKEATAGALAGAGVYRIQLAAGTVNVAGFFTYAVADTAVPPNVFVGVANIVANLESDTYVLTLRALGLMHENSVLDQTTFTADDNILTGRLRIYNSKANADAALAVSPAAYNTGKVGEYTINAAYTGTVLKTYKVVLEP